jgi:signal transduction histidine kinase
VGLPGAALGAAPPPALEAATAGALWPWLFAALAFVASAVAFFAWGYLLARLRPAGAMQSRGGPTPASARQAVAPTAGQEVAAPPPRAGATLPAGAWVEALPGAALLATRTPRGLVLAASNTAAKALWPDAAEGALLEALAGLSAGCRSAAEQLSPGDAASFDGWRFAALATLAAQPPQPACVLITPWPAVADENEILGSTLSHDLRAPIRVVEGFTRIVKEDYGARLDRVGNDHLDRVLGAAARMNGMIDALLTMARLAAQPLARQPVDLSQLAHYVVDDLRKSDAGAREVEVDIEPALRAAGDPTLLRLVLENLIGNAWKYTAHTSAARIGVRGGQHEGRRAFVVSDNGAGFDMRSADRLFGLFQRLHSASDFPGHGVGLASVRRIVRRHGGDIWAEGRPGQGATFTFTLG